MTRDGVYRCATGTSKTLPDSRGLDLGIHAVGPKTLREDLAPSRTKRQGWRRVGPRGCQGQALA